MYEVFPKFSSMNLELEANKRAGSTGMSPDECLQQLVKEFKSYGAFQFANNGDSTDAAIKQLRNKCILAGCGSINLFQDEIGLKLGKLEDASATILEMFDKGTTKNKLTKSTSDNNRYDELVGSVPLNLNLFGSPSKLLNGSKIETDFFELLETGFARRCFFSYSGRNENEIQLSPEEQYDLLTQVGNQNEINIISSNLGLLANGAFIGMEISVPKDVGVELITYKQYCEKRAKQLPEYAEIQKAELMHRYFKSLKLAGTYAFLDGRFNLTLDDLHQAIKFAEDSGSAMEKLFYREKPYERLAKYIADGKGKELTQVDIVTDLPFFKGSQSSRNDLINMAIAWGYKNNIIIKKSFKDGIELFSGTSLEPTDLNKLILCTSDYLSTGYTNYTTSFETLAKLVKQPNSAYPDQEKNFCNFHTSTGERNNQDMLGDFNTIVLDIDNGATIKEAQELLKDYTYILYTTKRHQTVDPETGKQYGDRFRIILPMNYNLTLDTDDYKEFMENVSHWLPFDGLDSATFQPSRKWACNENAEVYTNEGQLIDVLPFIPKTSRNEEYKERCISLGSMDNIERWFANQMVSGSRNNTLIKYGLMMVDAGLDKTEVKQRLLSFNEKLQNPLDEAEIYQTIFVTIDKQYGE